MFIDVVNAGWVPIYNTNLSEDVIGYMGAPDIALSYPWTHLISGHVGRLATRDDVAVHQQYIADIEASSREALASVNPVPFYVNAGANVWLGIKGHLNAVTEAAAAPVIAKYTGVLAAADIEEFTYTTTFAIMQSLAASTRARADRFTPDGNALGAGNVRAPGAGVRLRTTRPAARKRAQLGGARAASRARSPGNALPAGAPQPGQPRMRLVTGEVGRRLAECRAPWHHRRSRTHAHLRSPPSSALPPPSRRPLSQPLGKIISFNRTDSNPGAGAAGQIGSTIANPDDGRRNVQLPHVPKVVSDHRLLR